MITKPKIEIFRKYNGDSDGFAKCATKIERQLIDDKDWSIIDSAIQDLELISKDLCSEEYKILIKKKMKNDFDKETLVVIEKL